MTAVVFSGKERKEREKSRKRKNNDRTVIWWMNNKDIKLHISGDN